jgi:hypothetical protein
MLDFLGYQLLFVHRLTRNDNSMLPCVRAIF